MRRTERFQRVAKRPKVERLAVPETRGRTALQISVKQDRPHTIPGAPRPVRRSSKSEGGSASPGPVNAPQRRQHCPRLRVVNRIYGPDLPSAIREWVLSYSAALARGCCVAGLALPLCRRFFDDCRTVRSSRCRPAPRRACASAQKAALQSWLSAGGDRPPCSTMPCSAGTRSAGALGQLLTNGLLDHARAGEPISAPGSAMCARRQHSV